MHEQVVDAVEFKDQPLAVTGNRFDFSILNFFMKGGGRERLHRSFPMVGNGRLRFGRLACMVQPFK